MSNEWSAYRLLFEADRKSNETRFDAIDETLHEIQDTLAEMKAQRGALSWASNLFIPGAVAVAVSYITRKLGLLMVVFLLLTQVASAEDKGAILESVELFGKYAIGHACAVDEMLITNDHVANPRPFDPMFPLAEFRYSAPTGEEGFLRAVWISQNTDIALLETPKPLTVYGKSATEAPKAGDTLRWVGYSWKKRSEAFAATELRGRVLRIVAGHIIVDAETWPGTSGGCVLNGNGEVVGIVVASMGTEDDRSAAIMIATYGAWLDEVKAAAKRLAEKEE